MSLPAHLSVAGAGGLAVALAGATYQAGMVRVSVEEKRPDGEHIRLAVPAILIHGGLKLVPDAKLQELPADARRWMPVIRIASAELARCPDGPLVEIRDQNERVTIAKRKGALVIDVDSTDETVHLSVPLRTLALVARELESASPAP